MGKPCLVCDDTVTLYKTDTSSILLVVFSTSVSNRGCVSCISVVWRISKWWVCWKHLDKWTTQQSFSKVFCVSKAGILLMPLAFNFLRTWNSHYSFWTGFFFRNHFWRSMYQWGLVCEVWLLGKLEVREVGGVRKVSDLMSWGFLAVNRCLLNRKNTGTGMCYAIHQPL